MQVDKPRTPQEIRNIDPRRKTPPPRQVNTRVEDKQRIMNMHEILYGKKIVKASHNPQHITTTQAKSGRQISPQKVHHPQQIVQVQTKKVEVHQV